MRHGSLFSGIGGFDLAAQWMGWENVFQVEIDPFCQAVLKKNFPQTQRHGDIKTFDGTKYRGTIDILSGGFPCQPYSTAGKRKGKEDSRHLWPEMLRVIREVQPVYVVGENVRGLTNWNGGLVFDEVQADLETEGYEVLPFLLPACAVNAPHRRDRIWFIAYSTKNYDRRAKREFCKAHGRPNGKLLPTPCGTSDRLCIEGAITNTSKIRCVSRRDNIRTQSEHAEIIHTAECRPVTNSAGIRWIQGLNRYESKVNNQDSKGNAWKNFPTISPLRNGDDGIPSRLVRSAIEAGGNAIVPQVAYEIFKAIEAVAST